MPWKHGSTSSRDLSGDAHTRPTSNLLKKLNCKESLNCWDILVWIFFSVAGNSLSLSSSLSLSVSPPLFFGISSNILSILTVRLCALWQLRDGVDCLMRPCPDWNKSVLRAHSCRYHFSLWPTTGMGDCCIPETLKKKKFGGNLKSRGEREREREREMPSRYRSMSAFLWLPNCLIRQATSESVL